MNIIPIPALKDNYIWCIVLPKLRQCVVIDPGAAEPVLAMLQQHSWQLGAILITHHHWDHTGGVAQLYQRFRVPIYGGSHEKNIPDCQYPVQEGDVITIEDLQLKVLDIPGHTLGHVAYYGEGAVFTGDTLFTGGCGKIFEGTTEQMLNSLQKLSQLPDKTLIYCGHEYTEANLRFALAVEPTNSALVARIKDTEQLRKINAPTVPATLKLEKETNPFLRVTEPAVIKATEKYTQRILANPIEVFKNLRAWKNNF